MTLEQRGPQNRQLDVGAEVEVRNRFVGKWCHGFEVADHVDGGYVIRRVSDRAVLPAVITYDEVRSDRRNEPSLGLRREAAMRSPGSGIGLTGRG
jgi:hypothetical protein